MLLFDEEGQILLIRNSYGRSDLFMLPGGGIRPFESPQQAAIREVKEELGCDVVGLVPVSMHTSVAEGKRDLVHLFKANVHGFPRADRFEVQEARFFGLDDLPGSISAATRRRIEEYLGKRHVDGAW